jgi:HAD superfamily hydrolase (TIGR01509 family)
MSVEEIIRKMGERAIEEYTYNVPAKDNVIRVLRELKQQGAGLNILTASPHVTLDPCLKRLGIFELFDNVWSCDDFGTTKADTDIYIRAAKLMGENVENVLFLDDNYNADKTAKLAGMKVCGVYDESSKEFEEEMRLLCDYYIKDFSELL